MSNNKDIDDLIKMIRLRERSEVYPDAPVERYGKKYKNIESYTRAIIRTICNEVIGRNEVVRMGVAEDHFAAPDMAKRNKLRADQRQRLQQLLGEKS